jgi:lysophospholipid acyltransferase (LPLAT)-like uncharacterized protein
MRVRDRIAVGLTGLLGPAVFRGAYSTLKFELSGESHLQGWRSGEPVVFVTWHGRILPLLYLFRDHGIVMLVSQHRDGEYLTRVGRGLGYHAVRGSSTRGGHGALRQLVRQVRAGRSLAITPDGPQGPKERLKPGALQVARISGAPVIPIMAGGDGGWWIEGWDRFMVPKPRGTIRVAVGEATQIPREVSVRGLEEHAGAVEARLDELKRRVDGLAP